MTTSLAITLLMCTLQSEAQAGVKNYAIIMGGSAEEMYASGALDELKRLGDELEQRKGDWEVTQVIGPGVFSPKNIENSLGRLEQKIRANGKDSGDQVYLHVQTAGTRMASGQHGIYCEAPELLRSQKILDSAKRMAENGAKVAVILDACNSGIEQNEALPFCLVTTTPPDFVGYAPDVPWADHLIRLPEDSAFEDYFIAMRRSEKLGVMEISSIAVPWARSFTQFFHVLDPGLADFIITLRPDLKEVPLALMNSTVPRPIDSVALARLVDRLQAGDEVFPNSEQVLQLADDINVRAKTLEPLYAKRLRILEKIREQYKKDMTLEVSDFPSLSDGERREGVAFFGSLSQFDLDALRTLTPLTIERLQQIAWLNPTQKKWYTWLLTQGDIVGEKLKEFHETADKDWKELLQITETMMDSYSHLVEKERELFDRFKRVLSPGLPDPCTTFRL